MTTRRSFLNFIIASFLILFFWNCKQPTTTIDTPEGGNSYPAPSALSGTALSTTSISLRWTDNATDETGFILERSLDSSSDFLEVVTIPTADTTSYVDSGLQDGTLYYYRIKAYGSRGESPYSNVYSISTLQSNLNAPAAPTDLSLQVLSTSSIKLTWTDNSDDEDGFDVFRSIGILDQNNIELISFLPADSTEFTDTNLDPATQVIYWVASTKNDELSDPSNIISAVTFSASALAAPANLTASQGTVSEAIVLDWDDVAGAVNYKIYFSDSSEGIYLFYDVCATSGAVLNGAAPGSHTFFKVSAVDSGGNETNWSNWAEGWAGSLSAITPPSSVSSSQNSYSWKIDISWSAVASAEQYNIYRSTSQNGTYTYIGSVSSASTSTYNSTSSPASYPIVPGTHYYYKITATDAGMNESEMSSYAEGWAAILQPPTGVVATQGTSTDYIRVSWTSDSYAIGYAVYYATSSGGTYSFLNTTTSSYMDITGATPGATYYFKVSSVDADSNESSLSSYVSGWEGINAPSGVTAEPYSSGTIKISWTDNSTAESGFYIYRSTSSSGTYSLIASVSANSTSYYNSGLSNFSRYYYKVRAYYGSRTSADSNIDDSYVLNPPSLSVSYPYSGRVDLSWTFSWPGIFASSNDKYSLEYRIGSAGTWYVYNEYTRSTSSVTVTYSVAPIYFRIRAFTTSGWSAYSTIRGPYN